MNQVSNGPGALPGMLPGPEGVKMLSTNYRKEIPNLQDAIDEQTAEGNTVVTRWTAQGAHHSELADIPETGRAVMVVGMRVDRVENGKIVESRGLFDPFGMLQQLGVIPAPQPQHIAQAR
jgi:predicted ester cyclase